MHHQTATVRITSESSAVVKATTATFVSRISKVSENVFAILMATLVCVTPVGAGDIAPSVLKPPGLEKRIVGGSPASPGEYPFQVSLQPIGISRLWDKSNQLWEPWQNSPFPFFDALAHHACGGTIIDAQWVLTAAHCIHVPFPWGNTFFFMPYSGAVAGVNTLSLAVQNDQIPIAEHYIHPSYANVPFPAPPFLRGAAFDLALIRLAAPTNIAPVLLGDANLLAPLNTPATAIGWGISGPNPVATDNLQEVVLPVVQDALCPTPGTPAPSDIVCAGYLSGPSVCGYDSGGPLLVDNGNGRWVQIGVTSYRAPSGCNSYGAFTQLTRYRQWISKTIAKESLGPPVAVDDVAAICRGGTQHLALSSMNAIASSLQFRVNDIDADPIENNINVDTDVDAFSANGGSVTIGPYGWLYTPQTPMWTGVDTIDYQITTPFGSDTGTITINVRYPCNWM